MKSLRWWMITGVVGSWLFPWNTYGESFPPPPVSTEEDGDIMPPNLIEEGVSTTEEEAPPQVSVEYHTQPSADLEEETPNESDPIASIPRPEQSNSNHFGEDVEPRDPIGDDHLPDTFEDVGDAPPSERSYDSESDNWL